MSDNSSDGSNFDPLKIDLSLEPSRESVISGEEKTEMTAPGFFVSSSEIELGKLKSQGKESSSVEPVSGEGGSGVAQGDFENPYQGLGKNVEEEKKPGKLRVFIMAAVLVFGVGGFFVLDDPEVALEMYASLTGEAPPAKPYKKKNVKKKNIKNSEKIRKKTAQPAIKVPVKNNAQQSKPNPLTYHNLLNVKNPKPDLKAIWSAKEEQAWRRGIVHAYPWQRYKSVLEVKLARRLQSQVILWDALEDSQFWVRMRAVMSLAEFGEEISQDSIKKALGNANPELVANFFKRFYSKNTLGERHIMRHALSLVSEKARFEILKVLANYSLTKENHTRFFLLAKKDKDLKIRKFANKQLMKIPSEYRMKEKDEMNTMKDQHVHSRNSHLGEQVDF